MEKTMTPVKTKDIVVYNGLQYIVTGIQLTDLEPVVEIRLLGDEIKVIPLSSVVLSDQNEQNRRSQEIESSSSGNAPILNSSDADVVKKEEDTEKENADNIDIESMLSASEIESIADDILSVCDTIEEISQLDTNLLFEVIGELARISEDYQVSVDEKDLIVRILDKLKVLSEFTLDEEDRPPQSGSYELKDDEFSRQLLSDLNVVEVMLEDLATFAENNEDNNDDEFGEFEPDEASDFNDMEA